MAFVIGVAGQAQMGKDTLADRLQEVLNWNSEVQWQRAAFAHGVKEVYADTFGVSREFIEEWKVKDEVPPGFDMTVRKSLQFIGDGFRQIRSSVWVDRPFRTTAPKIISDVRYPNEFEKIKQEGGINILVGRTDKLSDDPNGSEALIKPYVEWALAQECEEAVNVHLNAKRVMESMGAEEIVSGTDAPEGTDNFHLFVQNDGTLDEFYNKIDNIVVPYIQSFSFEKR